MKKALVTGATSGIGEALSHVLAAQGFSLILTGRNASQLERLKQTLQADVIQADLSLDCAPVLAAIRQHVPDLVINNAGCGLYGNSLDLELKEQVQLLDLNARACLQIAVEAARCLRSADKPGTIFNVSSMAALLPTPGMAVYGASKAFLTSLSQALDFEYKPFGIRVLNCLPGMVDTAFAQTSAKHPVSRSALSMDPLKSRESPPLESLWAFDSPSRSAQREYRNLKDRRQKS